MHLVYVRLSFSHMPRKKKGGKEERKKGGKKLKLEEQLSC